MVDPWTDLRERESFEHRETACPPGKHGVKRHRRTVTQEFNKSDAPVGAPVHGAWESAPGVMVSRRLHLTTSCSRARAVGTRESRFNQNMEATETWRVPVRVSADPDNPVGGTRKTTGASEFVASTCWGTAHGPVPVPTTNHEYFTETSTVSCPSGMTGQIATARQRITTTTTYPWGEEPLVTVDYTNWSETANTCARIPSPDHGGEGGGETTNANETTVEYSVTPDGTVAISTDASGQATHTDVTSAPDDAYGPWGGDDHGD